MIIFVMKNALITIIMIQLIYTTVLMMTVAQLIIINLFHQKKDVLMIAKKIISIKVNIIILVMKTL